jgi:dinuclear metal center YbgI/SA1388 family protein
MITSDVFRILESWAPQPIAWDRDDVGLQIGSPDQTVKKILIALDVTDGVVEEARIRNIDLLVTHHPLYFHSPRSLHLDQRIGRLSAKIIQGGFSVYSLHTNLDYTHNGVSIALAEALGLANVTALQPLSGLYQKVVVFVPVEFASRVFSAMAEQGAGTIGKYDSCSFQVQGNGTFRPLAGARPYIGTQGEEEHVSEQRLEMIVPRWKTLEVLRAMRKAHPYEEVAYDIYDLSNPSPEYGAGAIGSLQKKMIAKDFLRHVKKRLRTSSLRHSGSTGKLLRTIAVCGGSGSEYLETAIRSGADAFVTADIRYHTFQESDNRILLIDAGHYETEAPIIKNIITYLRAQSAVKKEKIQIIPSREKTNFIHHI